MCRKNPIFINNINNYQQPSWDTTNNALVSQTLNIYANAINSCLLSSPAKAFANVNLPSRILNLEGFSWQKGYRTPLAFLFYKKTYYHFLKALYLVTRVREKGGGIYVIFDENQNQPCSNFLTNAQKSALKKTLQTPQNKPSKLNIQGINTGRRDHNIYRKHASLLDKYENISWSGDQWVGGTFSNKKQVFKSIILYKTLSRQFLKILEKKTSPRYLALAKKYHGNLFFSKPEINTFLLSTESRDLSGFSQPVHRDQGRFTKVGMVKGSQVRKSPIIGNKCLTQKRFFKCKTLPDLIIVENAEKHRHIIAEAETLKIPLIAFVESDFSSNISIALPLNALKHYFLAFLLHII